MRVRAWSTGPLLASLGASAVLVGLVSGAGEAMALLLRLVSGSWADLQRALLDAHVRRLCPHCGLRAGSGHYTVPGWRRAGGGLRPGRRQRHRPDCWWRWSGGRLV